MCVFLRPFFIDGLECATATGYQTNQKSVWFHSFLDIYFFFHWIDRSVKLCVCVEIRFDYLFSQMDFGERALLLLLRLHLPPLKSFSCVSFAMDKELFAQWIVRLDSCLSTVCPKNNLTKTSVENWNVTVDFNVLNSSSLHFRFVRE